MPARKKPSSKVSVISAGAEAKPAARKQVKPVKRAGVLKTSQGAEGTSVEAFSETLRALKRKIEENLDQLALVQGVLEELCERQEALSAWQMEFAKRTVSLGEAQWRALEGLAGQSAFAGFRSKAELLSAHKNAAAEASSTDAPFNDSLDEATEFLGGLSADLAQRREVRSRVHSERATTRRRAGESGNGSPQGTKGAKGGPRNGDAQEAPPLDPSGSVEAPESILVLPEKTDFH
jgi:hypothetical protein